MVSQNKIEANRRNAQLSTGPRTEEGQAISSQNALQHALTARSSGLLPGEDPLLYQQFIAQSVQGFCPQTALETSLALKLAHLAWQQGRFPAALVEVFALEAKDRKTKTPESTLASAIVNQPYRDLNGFERLQRYEASLDRCFSRTLHDLLQLQKSRQQNEATQPPPAEALAPVQDEPTAAPPAPVQDEPTAPPITLSPGHLVTLSSSSPAPSPTHPLTPSSSPSPKLENKPTAAPRQLTPAQRRRLRFAVRNGGPNLIA